jgi:hypothetical protein
MVSWEEYSFLPVSALSGARKMMQDLQSVKTCQGTGENDLNVSVLALALIPAPSVSCILPLWA